MLYPLIRDQCLVLSGCFAISHELERSIEVADLIFGPLLNYKRTAHVDYITIDCLCANELTMKAKD